MSATVGTEEPAIDATLRFDLIVRRLREKDMTIGSLAEMAGVDRTTIWRYRHGMKPGVEVAMRIASALNLTLDELTSNHGNPTPAPPPGPSSPAPPPGPRAGK